MVPAACALLWALLLSEGPRAAGAHDQTPGAVQPASVSFEAPSRSRLPLSQTAFSPKSRVSQRFKVTAEDEDDLAAEADRLASPATADLLASTVTGMSRSRGPDEEDETLEEGVVIDASKPRNKSEGAKSTSADRTKSTSAVPGSSPQSRFPANVQEPEIRVTSNLQPASTTRSKGGEQDSEATTIETTLSQWTTAGSTPSGWPSLSSASLTSTEDLQLQLLPWGPWHCHCKSGTMSRSRAGKLHGLSGRLRVGALSQLRTEHRPCTYDQCSCNRQREECPLDTSTCSGPSCTTQTTTLRIKTTTTSTTFPSLSSRLRPAPAPPIRNSALEFWKRVRIGLEDIWNSLSSVFTEMQPIDKNQR
ncbi:protein MENT [Erinaceus europaeus]|uniref:Protein MENT n=1 Tax=Erinaceus europaeus TaxID=9365 RepID=A0A1S3A9S9_ERIEU|nr:protein MENT [Erinaceus europaeus]